MKKEKIGFKDGFMAAIGFYTGQLVMTLAVVGLVGGMLLLNSCSEPKVSKNLPSIPEGPVYSGNLPSIPEGPVYRNPCEANPQLKKCKDQ